MSVTIRTATTAEIIEEESWNIKNGSKVQYRHFVKEIYNPRAKNGVSHRQHTRSKITVIKGVPHVRYNGELVAITGKHFLFENGFATVGLYALDNPHLPSD